MNVKSKRWTVSLVLVALACTKSGDDCRNTATCGGTAAGEAGGGQGGESGASDSAAGTKAKGGSSSKGGTTAKGGTTSRGGTTARGGTTGTGGSQPIGGTSSASSAPCNGACAGATPFCIEATNTCVACLSNSSCPLSSASRCDATTHACAPCSADSDCSQITGKGICDAGNCVQCTVAKETPCGTNSCNPGTKTCTSTAKGSVELCQTCTADSECTTREGTIRANCVPVPYAGTFRANYCLEKVSSGCTTPFSSDISVSIRFTVSTSGAASDSYCGFPTTAGTCEALLDMVNDKPCSDAAGTAVDSLCGCHRDASGACTDAGVGGFCRDIGGANVCTIDCAASASSCFGRICKYVLASGMYCM